MNQAGRHPYAQTLADFKILRVIGKGCLGKVMLARHLPTSQLVALKSIPKQSLRTEQLQQSVLDERHILANLHTVFPAAPFLIHLYAAFQTPTHLFLVLEYHCGGDFASVLAQKIRLDEPVVCFYAAEIYLGLRTLHERGIVYRDLKPENVLLDRNGHAVLTDFGLSKAALTSGLLRTICGTPEYLAPEILLGEPYDRAIDLWSFGTLLYELLLGSVGTDAVCFILQTPYWDDAPRRMFEKIVAVGRLDFPCSVSSAAADIVSKLLRREPSKRLGYRNMDEIKWHPFFPDMDWSYVERRHDFGPLRPACVSEWDTSAFDEAFTEMPTAITPRTPNQLHFAGFSYFE